MSIRTLLETIQTSTPQPLQPASKLFCICSVFVIVEVWRQDPDKNKLGRFVPWDQKITLQEFNKTNHKRNFNQQQKCILTHALGAQRDFDAKKYNGVIKLKEDALDIQKRLRDEWERDFS